MTIKFLTPALLGFALSFSSCGLIFKGSERGIEVNQGFPENAHIWYNNNYVGSAPTKIHSQKFCRFRHGCQVIIRADGFIPDTVPVTSKANVNFLVMDLVGIPALALGTDRLINGSPTGLGDCHNSCQKWLIGGIWVGVAAFTYDLLAWNTRSAVPGTISYNLRTDTAWNPQAYYRIAPNDRIIIRYGKWNGRTGTVIHMLTQHALVAMDPMENPREERDLPLEEIRIPYNFIERIP